MVKEKAIKQFLPGIVLISVFVLNSLAFAQTVKTKSKVTQAIVYINSAQITRQAQVDVKEGFHEIIFINVPENPNKSTLTISTKGNARAKVLNAKIKDIFLQGSGSKRVISIKLKVEKQGSLTVSASYLMHQGSSVSRI